MYIDDDDEEGRTCTTPSCPSAECHTEGPSAGAAVGPDRMEALRSEWTFSVQKGSNSKDREEIVLEDVLIKKLESIRRRLKPRTEMTQTSFSGDDKTLFVQGFWAKSYVGP